VKPEFWIAIISSLVALLSVAASGTLALRTTRLQHELERERHKEQHGQHVEEVMRRYREPILRAAYDLQSRIYNIEVTGFMRRHFLEGDPDERVYARTNTLFVLAEYLGWVEILRRDVQFLDLSDAPRNLELVERLDRVAETLANTAWFPDAGFRLYRGEQRAIGELMIEPAQTGSGRTYQCIGYVSFIERLEHDPVYQRWFGRLGSEMERIAKPAPQFLDRMIRLQGDLIDLIDLLDDPPVRFPAARRQKLAPPPLAPDRGPASPSSFPEAGSDRGRE